MKVSAFLFAAVLIVSGCSRPAEPLRCSLSDRTILQYVSDQCAIIPRNSGTPGACRTAEYLKTRAAEIPGVRVSEESFSELTPNGKILFRNVIAEMKGSTDAFVIVGAHYDAKAFASFAFQAANDGASGTAAMLAMMHTLAGKKLHKTVRFVFFDGEECFFEYGPSDGLHGSRYHAGILKKTGAYKRCSLMLLLDMVGDRDLQLTIPKDTSARLTNQALHSAKILGHASLITRDGPVMLDDHIPFQQIGIPSLLFIDFSYGPRNSLWHTPEDTLDKVSAASIRASAEIALEVLRKNGVF